MDFINGKIYCYLGVKHDVRKPAVCTMVLTGEGADTLCKPRLKQGGDYI